MPEYRLFLTREKQGLPPLGMVNWLRARGYEQQTMKAQVGDNYVSITTDKPLDRGTIKAIEEGYRYIVQEVKSSLFRQIQFWR